MKKALTNYASGSGHHETYGETLNLRAPANVYSIKHSLGQGPLCRLIEFSRFPIRLSVLKPWDLGDT